MVPAVLLFGLLAAPARGQEAGKGSQPGPVVTESEKLVQEQLEAYNRHDLEGFLKTYSPDIKLYDFPDKERASGLDAMRTMYGRLFEQVPDVKATIARRIIQGDYIIDHEEVNGRNLKLKAVAIYRVKDRKITAVWFVK